MLNEDKIKLMNEIATFEKKNGSKADAARRFFKSDYIEKYMLQSFFSYTICYILILILKILYDLEKIINTVNINDVIAMGKSFGVYYIAGLVIFELITVCVYSIRYKTAEKNRRQYIVMLKKLEKRYEFQDRSKELTREV